MRRTKQALKIEEDTSKPIKVASMESASKVGEASNRLLLSERYAQGRRPQVIIQFWTYARRGANPLRYLPLAGKRVTLSCPSPEQAESAIALIQAVARGLDGKWLAELADPPPA